MHSRNSASPLSQYRLDAPPPVQYPLVNRFYKHCGYRVSCGRRERVYVLRESASEEIHGAVRFLPQDNYWVLRNLCVVAHRRRQGLARLLLRQVLQQALQPVQGFGCYCFALGHLQAFYESAGFQLLHPEQTPTVIAETYRRYSEYQPDLVLMGLGGRLHFS